MRKQGRDDSAQEARTSSSRGSSLRSAPLPVALASHLNAAVMQQQLGKSPAKCVRRGCTGPRAAPRALTPNGPCGCVLLRSVPRGRNWAPSSEDSEDEPAPRARAVARSANPLQPALDFLFKPITELLCPMLMPQTHDALVREYCEELEKDRCSLAQQNVALERELEKLKLSAARRSRGGGRRSKASSLDRFTDMRIKVRGAHARATARTRHD
jgi:hypothetical protein